MKLRPFGYFVANLLFAVTLFVPGILQASAGEVVPFTKIFITGNTVLSEQDLAPITEPYLGKPITLETIKEIAGKITEEYKKRGYILATAYVPEQKVVNGAVNIAVVEGKIGEIKVTGSHKYYSTEFIQKHFGRVQSASAFQQDDLERALLVLNEYPKLKVTAMLQPGREPGTSDLVVTADNSFPMTLMLDYNNFGSSYVSGKARFGATFDIGNILTEGAILSLRGMSGQDPSDFLYGRVYYTIPVNTLGTRLGIYYAAGNFDVGRMYDEVGLNGESQAYGISVTHPFIKKRVESLTAEFGFEGKDSTMYLFDDEKYSEDNIRLLKLGATYENTDTTGRTFASLYLTAGLGSFLGGSGKDDDDMVSRAGGDNSYFKANANLIRLQRVFPSLYILAKASGQWSPDTLLASEQYYIGGQDSVRGFVQGEWAGDSGFSLTGEVRIAPFSSNRDIFQIALFADTGSVYLHNAPVGMKDRRSITGAGGGVRMNLPYDFNIRADVGFPIWPSTSLDGMHSMVYILIAKRF